MRAVGRPFFSSIELKMAPSQVKIRKFDPRTIPDDATVVFIGARGSGKSTAVRDVLYHHRHIPSGIAMSGTERYTNYWSSIIPRSFIFDEFSEEALASTMKHQQRLAPPGRPRDPAFVLCDDVMYSKELGTNKKVREVFMNGRHCNLLFLLSLQYAMDLPPALRSNIDFVVAFREPIVENRKKLYLNFFGQVPDFHTFETILHSCTANHEALVVNKRSRGRTGRRACSTTRRRCGRAPRTGGWGRRRCGSGTSNTTTRRPGPGTTTKRGRGGGERRGSAWR